MSRPIMTIYFIYVSNPIGVIATCTGTVTGEEIISVNEEVSKYGYHLLDCTKAEKINISLEEMQKLQIKIILLMKAMFLK